MKIKFSKITYKIGKYSQRQLKKMYDKLPQSRKDRVDRTENKTYKEFLIVEFFIVIKKLKLSNKQDFLYNEMGKPYFKNQKHNFSISHSKNRLIVVFSKNPIGVDLQHTLPFEESTAKDFCNDDEFKKIVTHKKRDKEFTKLWTQKESFVKLKGTTLYLDMKNILIDTTDYVIKTYQKRDYAISICVKNSVI